MAQPRGTRLEESPEPAPSEANEAGGHYRRVSSAVSYRPCGALSATPNNHQDLLPRRGESGMTNNPAKPVTEPPVPASTPISADSAAGLPATSSLYGLLRGLTIILGLAGAVVVAAGILRARADPMKHASSQRVCPVIAARRTGCWTQIPAAPTSWPMAYVTAIANTPRPPSEPPPAPTMHHCVTPIPIQFPITLTAPTTKIRIPASAQTNDCTTKDVTHQRSSSSVR